MIAHQLRPSHRDRSRGSHPIRRVPAPRTRVGQRKLPGCAISRYGDQVGFCKYVMIPRTADGRLGNPTPVIRAAHHAVLTVVGWTFRRENSFHRRPSHVGAVASVRTGQLDAYVAEVLRRKGPAVGPACILASQRAPKG